MMDDTPAKVGVIGSYYGTSSNDLNYFPVSLMRHPLCNVTSSTLSTTLTKNVPSGITGVTTKVPITTQSVQSIFSPYSPTKNTDTPITDYSGAFGSNGAPRTSSLPSTGLRLTAG